MICLGVLTDGRAELLERTIKSSDHLGVFGVRYIVNDSGDVDYNAWLRGQYPEWGHVFHKERRGLARAVQSVWDHALDLGADYLFHLEGDWEILGPIDTPAIVSLLERYPYLAEIVLQRQPLTPSETEAGGVAAHRHWTERSDAGAVWVEQHEIFSLNPCMIPARVLERGWPSGPIGIGNETGMTDKLRGEFRFGFWGPKTAPPQVWHLGDYRAPGWAL